MKKAVVVADDDQGLAFCFEFRQELIVEDPLELRILIGRPFIKM